jgi:fructose-1,6-bisphosphatase/inositol monophosphatase family enzyme
MIVKEAGGFFCDLNADKNDPFKTGNVLAANEGVYNTLKKVLRS